jgi:hypothetical protein
VSNERRVGLVRIIVVLVAIVSGVGPSRSSERSGAAVSVIAKSRFGNGEVRGLIRRTNQGWQVQLPGGRWVDCRRSCSETLRVETVDFWQANGAGSGQLTNECGIFGCLELKYPH